MAVLHACMDIISVELQILVYYVQLPCLIVNVVVTLQLVLSASTDMIQLITVLAVLPDIMMLLALA